VTVREIGASEITRVVRELCIEINYEVPEEMVSLMREAREKEESPLGRQILDLLIRSKDCVSAMLGGVVAGRMRANRRSYWVGKALVRAQPGPRPPRA
jgi:hypothetical protein